jgi:hypothetical protein
MSVLHRSEHSGTALTAQETPRIDTSVVHPARRYNYWLGGKDHFQADRESGDAIAAMFPTVRAAALANRAFMRRAVATIAEAGVHQFLDIGTGIPAPGNTHEVAQTVAPDSRVVYVDNDPIVLAHARALLTSAPGGAAAYIEADLRDWRAILETDELRATIDLSRPVGLLLVAILHFLTDDDEVAEIVSGLLGRLARGSYVVISHGTFDFAKPEIREAGIAPGHGDLRTRTAAELAGLLTGLELLDPGIVSVSDWRAQDEPGPRLTPEEAGILAVVARVP